MRSRARRGGLPLPPGPLGIPWLGNVIGLDVAQPWVTYTKYGEKYGGLVYTKLLGQDLIVINDEEVAIELLERRSAIYSGRPVIATNELFGMDFNTGLLQYGPHWKFHRKLFHTALRAEAAQSYDQLQMSKARQFVRSLAKSPERFEEHLKTLSASIIMAITYGYDAQPEEDPFVEKVEQLIGMFLTALTPERAALIGAIPFLAHIPSWMPGGRYKLRANECRELAQKVLSEPYEFVKQKRAEGTAKKSMVSDLLDAEHSSKEVSEYDMEKEIMAVATTVFLGGAETTYSSVYTFLLAMILYPDVQRKAQDEIDQVVGHDRLPDFADRPNLPYIEGVLRETLRWHHSTPVALPHATTDSDVYKGYYIPKGALLLVNLWAMTHNPRQFASPELFMPERYLDSPGHVAEKPFSHPFGFGRRICPGRYVADGSVWATIVSVLATFRIVNAKDGNGESIEVKEEFLSGLAVRPKPFRCGFEKRWNGVETILGD
ncbi:cytochrome P450 [Coniophora puteana RWD-64-598 SS2]|uniref:Cytochrome P450 n=1 Tax=Coniophora puteana (strain RWD-64-598) TaxID=741705 RepID=A0A5M3MYJ4_CONPW|nr:cytochrome P450 [Coniophora puteana RWD-64-598 SS2]EIW83715.1 cytochrome P450 [Coniophora puteana RWD-64-598 SS2]